jgi:trimethylamine--corrinoid protein Co-methyltransferase
MRPIISILESELIPKILAEAKRILAEIGLEVMNTTLRTRLLDYGFKQDPASKRLLFPPDEVDRALASTPRSFRLYNRQGEPHTELGEDRVHFVPGSSGVRVLDHRTGQTRSALTADFVDYVRLADGLSHIAYLATAFSTHDIEPKVSDAWRLYLCLIHSLKPVVSGAFTAHGTPRMAQMMQLFRSDKADLIARPMSIFTITPTGMFRYSEDSCQNLIDCVEWGIPVEIVPVTLMGLIAPVTPIGATVMHVADVLAGITMAQILKSGTPVLFGGAPATFHMKTTASPMAAIEALRLDLAYVAVAKSLGLPTQAYMALSDSKFVDAQGGAEAFGSALLAALAGVNSVSGPGMLDYVLVFSLEKLVFDNELCGQALHFIRDFSPLEDLPTVDLARRLLQDQHLLVAEHTLKYWPQELYLPGPAFDRLNRDRWEKVGQPSLHQRTLAEVERLLAAYTPVNTDPQIDAEMRRLIKTGLPVDSVLPQFEPAQPSHPPASTSSGRARPRPRPRRPTDTGI